MASGKLETATKTCLGKSGFRISSDATTGLAQRISLMPFSELGKITPEAFARMTT
jgi:hypothetical protein